MEQKLIEEIEKEIELLERWIIYSTIKDELTYLNEQMQKRLKELKEVHNNYTIKHQWEGK